MDSNQISNDICFDSDGSFVRVSSERGSGRVTIICSIMSDGDIQITIPTHYAEVISDAIKIAASNAETDHY